MLTDKKTDAPTLDHATLEAMRLRAIGATIADMDAADLALIYASRNCYSAISKHQGLSVEVNTMIRALKANGMV